MGRTASSSTRGAIGFRDLQWVESVIDTLEPGDLVLLQNEIDGTADAVRLASAIAITRLELRLAIVQWIEGIYHRKRRQRRLGKLTPIEFETIMKGAATLAA